jgi:4-carboxymuconolactone decarboxylase
MNSIWENKKPISLIMRINIYSLLIIFSLSKIGFSIGSEENNMEKRYALNQKQQSIIQIAAFTAEGDISRLKPSLNEGLDAGLTEEQMEDFISVFETEVSKARAESAKKILVGVLARRR